jgi:hypothetical protein
VPQARHDQLDSKRAAIGNEARKVTPVGAYVPHWDKIVDDNDAWSETARLGGARQALEYLLIAPARGCIRPQAMSGEALQSLATVKLGTGEQEPKAAA